MLRSRSCLSFPAMLALLIVLAAAFDCPADDVVLVGKSWTVSIDPQRLGVIGIPTGGHPLVLSVPRPTHSPVADLHHEAQEARWTLPADRVKVVMRLDEDVLVVGFIGAEPGSFTWPILGPDPAFHAYILPMFEGLYVPADDEPWAKFLVGQGPLDTTAGLSMPFWGIDCGTNTLTYVITNPFNNELSWRRDDGRLTARFTHTFPPNAKTKEYGLRICLGGASPIEPARVFRQHLMAQGQWVSFKEKMARTPEAAKLLGAAHVYLWGDGLIGRRDLANLGGIAQRIVEQSDAAVPSVGKRLWELMGADARALLKAIPAKEWVDNHDRGEIAAELSRILERRDFYAADAWRGVSLPDEARTMLKGGVSSLADAQVGRLNCLLLRSAFLDQLKPVESWGDGWSPKMLQALVDAGLDRLWLGSPSWKGLRNHPETVRKAIALGYLIGPYDSYHSIHSPQEADTWETAQFDQQLYETGAVVRQDGSKRKGFKQKGYILSPLAARPYAEKRVSDLMRQFQCNSWFIDCDAFGELFDDYSRLHPATQEEDMNARLSRMAWLRDTFKFAIGSEGGSAYAASTIHFAHGMMTPVIGWDDADMKNRASQYFLGAYYPPDGPAIFFKQVPLKPEYRRVYADPRYRLPLYEMVFHDSVVATHQWGYGSLKFTDEDHARELLELLYGVPPLYHLNLDEWPKRRAEIKAHCDFFSPLHRQAGLLPMTEFAWLTEDRLVQRTVFGDTLELVANFGEHDFAYQGTNIPPRVIWAKSISTASTRLYSPGVAPAGSAHRPQQPAFDPQ